LWNYTAHALDFFRSYLPFTEMTPRDDLVDGGTGWCLAKPGEVYAVFVFGGKSPKLQLPAGSYSLSWFDPRKGGKLIERGTLAGPAAASLGEPPADAQKDWVALVRKARTP
jgi:hypothetical protein